jgi:hypothetical protein
VVHVWRSGQQVPRERLLEDGRADRLLDLALARLKEAGLVRASGCFA